MTTPPPPLPAAAPGSAPMTVDPLSIQHMIDRDHLQLLSVFHYIMGGLTFLFSFFIIFYIIFGAVILAAPEVFDSTRPAHRGTSEVAPPTATDNEDAPQPPPPHRHGERPPRIFGALMMGFGVFLMLLAWIVGGLLIYSGRCLARQTHRTFSLVIAALNCVHLPFGTILGVFTLVVLQRPTVKMLYAAQASR